LPQAWQPNRDSISDRRKPDLYGALNSEAAARREEQIPVSFAERFRPIQQRDIYQSGFAAGGAPDGDYYDPFSGIKILSADDNAAAGCQDVGDYISGMATSANNLARRFTNYDRQFTEDVLNAPR
jgi:hypothetical protein